MGVGGERGGGGGRGCSARFEQPVKWGLEKQVG